MSKDSALTFVDAIQHIADNINDSATSLPEFVQGTRNDFLTLVEADVADMPEIKDILGVANTLVASYYLAAFTLHMGIPGVDVRKELDKFAVERSPIKTAIKFALGIGLTFLAGKSIFGRESYAGTLGKPGDFGKILATESFNNQSLAARAAALQRREDQLVYRENRLRTDFERNRLQSEREAIRRERDNITEERRRMDTERDKTRNENERDKLNRERDSFKQERERDKLDRDRDSFKQERERDKTRNENERDKLNRDRDSLKQERERDKLEKERKEFESERNAKATVGVARQDLAKHLAEGGDLSTGKSFDLTIERNGNRMPLNVNVSLSVLVADKAAMRTILGVGDYEYSFENRTMLASSGARKWIRDILLSRDLIDQMRKNRRADKTGFYKTVVATRNKNWISSIFGNISINNASSVIVVSSDTADEMEAIFGGPLEDYNVRQRIFKDTLTMLIFVVDRQWENVTIYHRGLSRHTELDFRNLRNSKGGNNMDVDEIIRAYQAGNAPLGR